MDFNMDQLRLSNTVFQRSETSKEVVAHPKSCERFIKGPIPISLLVKADSLPGQYTLRAALVIFYAQGLSSSKKIVIDRFHFDQFGIKKDSARRALKRLQKAGLIQYKKSGQKFEITIIHSDQSG